MLVHARALLTSTPEGVTDYIDGDLHDPGRILREAARTLDFTQPVALMMLGILNHIMDSDEAYAVVGRLVDALCPGSHIVMSHFTSLIDTEVVEQGMRIYNRRHSPRGVRVLRSRSQTLSAANPDAVGRLQARPVVLRDGSAEMISRPSRSCAMSALHPRLLFYTRAAMYHPG